MSEIVQNPHNLATYQVGTSPPDAIGLRLVADDGAIFVVRVKRGLIAPFVTQMMAQASALPIEESDRRIETQPLSAIGAQSVVGPQGQPGIAIRLAGGLRLTLALTPEALVDLQTHLATLSQIVTPPSQSSH